MGPKEDSYLKAQAFMWQSRVCWGHPALTDGVRPCAICSIRVLKCCHCTVHTLLGSGLKYFATSRFAAVLLGL